MSLFFPHQQPSPPQPHLSGGFSASAISALSLTPSEALSTLFGSISLACWIFLLVPQIVENHRNRSASALSLSFLLLWAAGDVCNLVGAVWADLVSTVVAVGVYWCAADGLAVAQWLFYYWWNGEYALGREGEQEQEREQEEVERRTEEEDGEEEPLLRGQRGQQTRTNSSPGPVSDTRSRQINPDPAITADQIRPNNQGDEESNLPKPPPLLKTNPVQSHHHHNKKTKAKRKTNRHRAWVKNALSIALVILAGTIGWAIALQLGVWDSSATTTTTTTTPPSNISFSSHPSGAKAEPVSDEQGQGQGQGPIGAQILGYTSAIAYLGARIPQIIKNAQSKSCQGLSLLFFLLSVVGNLTYGLSILCYSLERDYLITNTPWLVGSLGTMVEDGVIFGQFWRFSRRRRRRRRGDEEGEEEEEEEEGGGGQGW